MATKAQVNEFIKTVGAAALKEAQERKASGKKWILPGICVSQGACECAWGTSKAMVNANGLFGFKVGSGTKFGNAWKGASYNTKTKEFYGEYVTISDNFRAYDNIQDAITDYMDLLCGASRYKNAVNNTNALSTITAIKNGGYATSPTYINTIMSIYNNHPEIAALDAEFLGGVCVNPHKEPTRAIIKGCKGDDVKWVQWHLNRYGYGLNVDGDCGPKTVEAITAFQKRVGIMVECGENTIKDLKK